MNGHVHENPSVTSGAGFTLGARRLIKCYNFFGRKSSSLHQRTVLITTTYMAMNWNDGRSACYLWVAHSSQSDRPPMEVSDGIAMRRHPWPWPFSSPSPRIRHLFLFLFVRPTYTCMCTMDSVGMKWNSFSRLMDRRLYRWLRAGRCHHRTIAIGNGNNINWRYPYSILFHVIR